MGFFSLKATCAICGKEVGLNRFKIGKTTDGKEIWACPACAKKGGLLKIDYVTGKAELIDNRDTETRKKCNVCGHVYCYTFADLERNKKLAKEAVTNSLLGVGEALGGTRIGSQIATNTADAKMNQIVDYSKCPKCNSTDVVEISKEEFVALQSANNQTTNSSADEIKKYKELLDSGIITQEEFDAKKKQLLGL